MGKNKGCVGARLDALARGRAEPVAVGREAERVDDLARVQRVQALALRQVPQHGHRVLRARALSLIRRAKLSLTSKVVRAGPLPRPCPAADVCGGGARVRTQSYGYTRPNVQAPTRHRKCVYPTAPCCRKLNSQPCSCATHLRHHTVLFARTMPFTRTGTGGRNQRAYDALHARRDGRARAARLAAGRAERAVGRHGHGVDVAGVADEAGAQLTVGEVPDLRRARGRNGWRVEVEGKRGNGTARWSSGIGARGGRAARPRKCAACLHSQRSASRW